MIGSRVMKVTLPTCRCIRRFGNEAPVSGFANNTETQMKMKSKLLYTGERGINKVTLVGRVGRDPEMRGDEKNTASIFSLATSQSIQLPDGAIKQLTDWHKIVVFRGGLKEIIPDIIKRGDKVYVTGSIKYSEYSLNAEDPPIKSTSIVADDVMVLSKATGKSDV